MAYSRMFEDESDTAYTELAEFGYGISILERTAYISVPSSMDGFLRTALAISAKETPVIMPLKTSDGETNAIIRQYLGIRANSENKDHGWNMIRIFLEEDMQRELVTDGLYCYVPVLRSEIQNLLTRRIYENVQMADGVVDIGELENDFVESYMEYLLTPDGGTFVSNLCVENFLETMTPFYCGEATYEECIEEFKGFASSMHHWCNSVRIR